MPRVKNDGRGRMGGRAKGTPNKATTDLREWIKALVDDNRAQIVKDLKTLEPRERLQFIEKLLRYVVPQESHVTQEATINNGLDGLLGKIRETEPKLAEWIEAKYSDNSQICLVGFENFKDYAECEFSGGGKIQIGFPPRFLED